MVKMKRTKYVQKQIYSIKPTKLIQFNPYYRTKSAENQSKVQSQLELSLAQLSPSLFPNFFI